MLSILASINRPMGYVFRTLQMEVHNLYTCYGSIRSSDMDFPERDLDVTELNAQAALWVEPDLSMGLISNPSLSPLLVLPVLPSPRALPLLHTVRVSPLPQVGVGVEPGLLVLVGPLRRNALSRSCGHERANNSKRGNQLAITRVRTENYTS